MSRILKTIAVTLLSLMVLFSITACGNKDVPKGSSSVQEPATEETALKEHEGEIMILYTSDVHCGASEGFGYVGLQQVRNILDSQGYTTLLVDQGDNFQGEALGSLTGGEAVLELMNDLHYDVSVPGNHDFDYGADHFLELAEKADFPYVCCNLTKDGKTVFPAYLIREVNGIKIAFVGVTTPTTITTSANKNFKNEKGEIIYGFMQDETGEMVYQAVQEAVDSAREEGADYVYVLGHLGNNAEASPWTYADVISHTNGIDVLLDGHSHDTDQVVMKNKDGQDVVRSAVGTKLNCIGHSLITPDKGIEETDIWRWNDEVSIPELLGIQNTMSAPVESAMQRLKVETEKPVAKTDFDLTIHDPKETDSEGQPIRMVRRAEVNMGDLVTDSMRIQTGADIAIAGGGNVRAGIEKGDITFGEIIDVLPFNNQICIVEATGQQILDALEWGAQGLPDEFGSFFQVSGLTYEINSAIPSGCQEDEDGMQIGIEGPRRVQNVIVGDAPIDPEKTYTVASSDYVLVNHGDGLTAFDNAKMLNSMFGIDSQVLCDYLEKTLGGTVSGDYADPYGQGRIKILE